MPMRPSGKSWIVLKTAYRRRADRIDSECRFLSKKRAKICYAQRNICLADFGKEEFILFNYLHALATFLAQCSQVLDIYKEALGMS